MDLNARRYARRILLIHAALLIIVLATMAAAAREIYISTRRQLVSEARHTQELLTYQTASGIDSHYQSILNDLDLLRRADNDATGAEKPTTESAEPTPPQLMPNPAQQRETARAAGRPLPAFQPSLYGAASSLFAPGSRSGVSLVMWKQVQGRVAMLFTMNRPVGNRTVVEVRQINSDDDRLKMMAIAQQSLPWIEQQNAPSFSKYQKFDGVGANLLCIPMTRGRDLIAVIPITGIEKQFLLPLNTEPGTSAWLIDEAGVTMAASREQLIGSTLAGITAPEFHDLANACVNHTNSTVTVSRNFTIGSVGFGPSIITAQPVSVGSKRWELVVTSSLDPVDGAVARLFHRALLWCIFLVVSVTAILLSTSIQMIRTRLRMERVRHEVLTREVSQARQIQLAWLPDRQPQDSCVDIAAVNHPASHISGDFYNWFELPDGRLVLTVGDVSGHGMSAAFLMATTQLLVRNTMMRVGDPGKCLEEVNRQLCVQAFNGQFVTMLVMIIDTRQGRLQIATAGHPAPLMADGESFQPLPIEPQLVLGVERETRYVTEQHDLTPQCSLLLYTDGVVDCPDARYARFGDERLRRSLYGRYENAQSMLERVSEAVNQFRNGRDLDDDLTLVAVQLQPVASTTIEPTTAAV